MSEIQTPPEQISPLIDEAFEDAFKKQSIDSSKKFFVENPIQETVTNEELAQAEAPASDLDPSTKTNHTKRRLIAGGVGLAVVAAAGTAATVANAVSEPPTFSEKTTEYTVQPGDGLYTVVESIPGINTIDERDAIEHVSVDPANIDVLKDGLQPGERIEVPISINGVKSSDK